MGDAKPRILKKLLASFVFFLIHGAIALIEVLNNLGFKQILSKDFWISFILAIVDNAIRVAYVFVTKGKEFWIEENGHFLTYGLGTLFFYIIIFMIVWAFLDFVTGESNPTWIHIASFPIALIFLIIIALKFGNTEPIIAVISNPTNITNVSEVIYHTI